jgi:WD40 repeat protein
MTAFDRFDPFERRISDAIDEIAAARPLDYLDDILQQTARSAQRPRWSFPERWLNVDTTLARPFFGRNVPFRSVIVIALLVAAIVAAIAFVAGSQRHLPAPFGPAANGQIVFGVEGDLYVRDAVDGTSRLLLGGPSDQGGAVVSPDGQLIAYDNVENGIDHAWVAEIDGSNPRQLLDDPFTGLTAQWSYDSRSMVLVTGDTEAPTTLRLWIAPADGSGARALELPNLYPLEATWDPTQPGVLLVRASDHGINDVDLYYVDAESGEILSTIVLTGSNLYGTFYEFSGLAFSPDGSTIAYNTVGAEAAGAHFWTQVMNRDGTEDRLVALPDGVPGRYSQAWPVFSPDGKWIAMESWVGDPGTGVRQLAVASADGAVPSRRIGPDAADHGMVKLWSPDGTRVLIHVDEIDDMYLIDPVTGDYEPLPWTSDFPNWQRVAR